MLKLQKIEIENYGNLQKVGLKGLRQLNILIGPNNSGKTHILRAINKLNEIDVERAEWNLEKDEKFLRQYKTTLNFYFEGVEGSVILYEDEDTAKVRLKKNGNLTELPEGVKKKLESVHILFCSEDRLKKYRDRPLEDFVAEIFPKLSEGQKDEIEEFLSSIDPNIETTYGPRKQRKGRIKIRLLQRIITGQNSTESFEGEISEQGSGIKSLICLMIDILASGADIILIDEPELGLNPAARQSFLKWLLKKSKEKQIFIATHDPSFVNPLLLGREDVSIYFFSVYKASKGENSFVRIDLSQIEDPNLFAGFMPHTTSLKGIHIYVEGGFDAYVFQGLLYSYLKSKAPSDWYKILSKVGIYHLHGDIWPHLLYTVVKEPYQAVVILDGDKKDDAEEKVKVLNEYGENKIFPRFVFCESIDSLRKELKKANTCPVYCLEKKDLREYFKERSKDEIINAAWSGEVPDEFHRLFEIVLSKYLSQKEELVFYDDFKEFKEWEQYGRGKIELSSDVAYKGRYSLKKDGPGDPNGGYKKLPKKINRKEVECIIFSGWIYRPSDRMGGIADRLAIEDENFNGYGFFAGHNGKLAIEKRTKGNPETLKEVEWKPIEDEWYQFKLIIGKDKLDLYIYNKEGDEIGKIEEIIDDEYDSFDQVAVHGGFVYYVDCLEVKVVKSPLSQSQ